MVAKKLYDIYVELRGDPENPNQVGPVKVLGGFKDWLLSPVASKEKKEEPVEETKKDPKGYIIAGSLFLVAVALLKVISGGSDGEGELTEASEELGDAAGKAAGDAAAVVSEAVGASGSKK